MVGHGFFNEKFPKSKGFFVESGETGKKIGSLKKKDKRK